MLPISDDNPTRTTPVITIVLIVLCVGVYFFVQPDPFDAGSLDRTEFTFERAAIPCEVVSGRPLSEDETVATLAFGAVEACDQGEPGSPEVFPTKNVWSSILVSMFLHGSLLHLGGNMLFLWVFGNNIEDHLGPVRYLGFYLLAGIVATAAHVAANLDSTVPIVGASGAIAGVMGAYLIWFPAAPVRTLIFVLLVRVPAGLLLVLWFLSQFYIDPSSGVASLAHVGGFVCGAVVGIVVRTSGWTRSMVWKRSYGRDRGSWDNRRGPDRI